MNISSNVKHFRGCGRADLPNLDFMNGQWLEHPETGALYVIPVASAVAEIDGPDGDICNALNASRRHNGIVPLVTIKQLGLDEIPDCLRRFNGTYYHA